MISIATTSLQVQKSFVLVNGLNSLPSAASNVNTGIKLMMVVIIAVMIAGATSLAASKTVSKRSGLVSFLFRCRVMFSVITMPTSIMVPITIAIPASATILASTPKYFIAIRHIRALQLAGGRDKQ